MIEVREDAGRVAEELAHLVEVIRRDAAEEATVAGAGDGDQAHDAAFDARIEGVLGDTARLGEAGARAALELVLEAGDADVPAPILELELPSLAALDEVARGALSRSPAVARVEGPDRGGIVRIVLQPLGARSAARVPLVLSWLGAGRVHGLSVVAYDAASPARMTTHAGRVIELGRAVER